MEERLLQDKLARLEFEHDQLVAEIAYVDALLKSVGFPRGLASVKETASEILNDPED